MAILDTLKSFYKTAEEYFDIAKANKFFPFAQAKVEEAYENAPTTLSEAFFSGKRLIGKGLVYLAGIITGVISVVTVSYFLLHALLQRALLAWLAAVTLGTLANQASTEDNQINLVDFTIKASKTAAETCYQGFKLAAPIVFSAGQKTGETLSDIALTSANNVSAKVLENAYNAASSTASTAYENATWEKVAYAASYVGSTLRDGAVATASAFRDLTASVSARMTF